jgi:hypothetical protein
MAQEGEGEGKKKAGAERESAALLAWAGASGRSAERGEGETKGEKVACRLGYWAGSGWFPTFFLFSLFKLKLKPI